MMVQKAVTEKTGTGTLAYSDMGEIITTSATAIGITLPAPSKGLWYRISNAGEGEVSVMYDSGEMTTIAQSEAVLLLSNGALGWWFSKGGGGGALTKEAIEAVLTGEISSHSHALTKEVVEAVLTGEITSHTHAAGDISLLDTAEHFTATDVEGALAELFTSVSDGKTALASAITDMGVTTGATDSFATMAMNIRLISAGLNTFDATATADEVLLGYTAYGQGAKIIGTYMPPATFYPFGAKTDRGTVETGEEDTLTPITETVAWTYANAVKVAATAETNIVVTLV